MTRSGVNMVVVGAGMAGLAAAIRAAELGLSVRLLEARPEERYPCNTRWSGGVFHVAFRSMRADPSHLAEGIDAITEGFVHASLKAALTRNSARSIEWLQAHGVEFGEILPTEGWRDLVLKPIGYHDRTGLRWEGLGADRMMDRLESAFAERGGAIERGKRADALLLEGGRCVGVRVAGGEAIRSDAVVLADGGFQGSPDLMRRFVTAAPERMRQRGPGTSAGDGIRMAEQAGAAFVGMDAFYGHLLSVDSLHNKDLWPFPFLDFLAASGVLLDRNARRFTDEGKGGVYMANATARHAEANPVFAVFDDVIWQEAGKHFFAPPNPNLVKAGGTLHRADTVDALASAAGLPAEALRASIAAHNAWVAAGGKEPASPARTDPKKSARPIATAPYYAAPGCAGISHTMGGVRIDPQARVLKPDGAVIPGLLAAGNVTGGQEGGPRAGYVGGLGRALVFGLISAETVAANRVAP